MKNIKTKYEDESTTSPLIGPENQN